MNENLDEAYERAEPSASRYVPEGWYVAQAAEVREEHPRSGIAGLRVSLRILEGSCKGTLLDVVCWLTEKALPVSKARLIMLGFQAMKPSQILAFQAFESLPSVRVRVSHAFRDGRLFQELPVIVLLSGEDRRRKRTHPLPNGRAQDAGEVST